jgi:hypothetical protein
MLVAGILGISIGACSKSGSSGGGGSGGSGGTTTAQVVSGGTTGSGGSAAGGTRADGAPESGGVMATGGTQGGGGAGTGGRGTGGEMATGGRQGSGGADTGGRGTGGAAGRSAQGTGGVVLSGGTVGTGGVGTGGAAGAAGGASVGGRTGAGGRAAGGAAGGGTTGAIGSGGTGAITSTGGTAGGKGGSTGGGTCTPSKPASANASGSGPHQVTVETNSDPGIKEGTIFRPADLRTAEKYPIFVWGEGACTENGLANSAAMGEIASHGYFVVADGTPNGTVNRTMDRAQLAAMGAPLMAYIDWAIAENDKSCSAYYQSLDTTKIAANGFSCGGLMSQAMVLDARVTTWGVNSSGMAGAAQDFYDMIHTPVLFVEGGPNDMAYDGALEGYNAISKLTVPVLWFSKDLGHGGDLSTARGGDFTKIDLAWLNWWLKGDETATGKGLLVGASCPYCNDSAWEYKSKNIP